MPREDSPNHHQKPAQPILQPLTLSLREHRVAVVGANGSGKSTLLRLINGLVPPSGGTVTVNGLDTVVNGREVRQLVGFMFTDPLSQLVMPTPLEDVELSLRRTGLSRSARRARALDWLDRFGLAALADNSVFSLSGGERQLVALASVLAVEPRILVLDEPSTLLDLANTERLRQLLAELPLDMVLATHDLDWAASADRLLLVDQGAIAYDGEPHRGIAQYRRLVAGRSAANVRGRFPGLSTEGQS
nr:ABC transporter ATP-binding protein [Psychromicrobium sp. YIM S02556]